MKPTPRGFAPTIIEFLRRNDGVGNLLPTAERVLELRQDVLAIVPAALRETCEVAGFTDGTLILRVASAGAAAKLRQTLPRLREGLLDRGWQVTAIRLRVQALNSVEISRSCASLTKHAQMPGEALAAFSELAKQLSDSPLKDAVGRLVRRRGGGAA